ncbi:evolutionarily conserved signaling intermediate in Toll pathway, mitochondrial [Phymastichus coffea]|uniref:evolutionarily conserved signaling intermediate in Toll pathway, mitochondrial n=1 Tax=Phymastichus coffea TaxID=108790 RepID=UPI00273BE935|nr:evolutionarily conserved signaling intermediate in Toll pathway, mitochondrial [Phymastichus coffea]
MLSCKYNMFSRIIRWSMPVSGIYRSCNKSNFIKQTIVQLDLLLVSNNTRYVSSSYTLLFSKQNPKKKISVLDNENECLESDQLNNETNKRSIKKEHVADSEEQEALRSDKLKDNREESVKPKDSEEFEKIGNKVKDESQEEQSDKSDKKHDNSQHSEHKRESVFAGEMVIHNFANARKKEKDTFLECLRMYKNQPGRKLERVPFIYAALKYMDEFGVEKDLSVYKALIDIFPKEKMIPTNLFQTMFMHYPKEQYCATNILEKMEDNGVIPDPEMELLLLSIFGRHGTPLEKYWRMMYWMPKFKNLNPWPVPKPIPNDAFELAKLAIFKISSIDVQSKLSEFDTNDVKDSIDKTWIISAIAPKQSELLLQHDKEKAIYVEGPFKIYVATKCVDYFTLRADSDLTREFPIPDLDAVDKIPNPYLETNSSPVIVLPSVHEQHDSTVFANCATGTSTKDSLLSWIRLLQKTNPVIGEIPVVFRLTNYSNEKLFIECGAEISLPRENEPENTEEVDKKLLDDK